MGILSAGGGDDRLQVGMAVFAIVMSLAITMMVPIVAPGYDTDTGYTHADIFAERMSLESFTGESMTNMAPWKLTAVYTPWTTGDPIDNIDPETGWAYGTSVTTYSEIGKTSEIRLDPGHKSDTPLAQSTYHDVMTLTDLPEWWAYNAYGDLNMIGVVAEWLGVSTTYKGPGLGDVNTWNFTGYRYEFDPMLKIDYSSGDHGYNTDSQSDAKLSIVWYKTSTSQGISGGLILYDNSTNGIVANITMDQINSGYLTGSSYSSRYQFDFQGVQVYLNLRYDLDVLSGGVDLNTAFDEGRWTLAITALSMDNYMDLSSSNSLSSSTANMIDTYIKIFTFSFPTLDIMWSIVLYVVCIMPVQIVLLMFLSRFGIVGLGLGIAGSAIMTALGIMSGS